MKATVKILSTKKLKPSSLELAVQESFDVSEHEFIEVRFVDPLPALNELELLKEYIAFTSRHAVQAIEKTGFDMKGKKIFSLSGETFQAVKKLKNVEVISNSAANAVALAEEIIATPGVKSLSFVCGEKRRDELPLLLEKNGIEVAELVVYHTIYKTAIVQPGFEGVLFFSPSAVESFFQSNILSKSVACFCVGNTTAAAVRDHTSNPLLVAAEPTQEDMIRIAKEYFFKKKTKRA